MDDKPADNSVILRKGWPVVIWLSRRLGEAERDAVLGDLTECDESGGRAIVNVLGLVVRRQAAVLLDLRLWVAVAFLILPLAICFPRLPGLRRVRVRFIRGCT